VKLIQADGSVVHGAHAEEPGTVEDFLQANGTPEWSALKTWARAFGIGEPGIWPAVAGLELGSRTRVSPAAALRLLEYRESVAAAARLSKAITGIESLLAKLAPAGPSAALVTSFFAFLTEASRAMNRIELNEWLAELGAKVERATDVLDERLRRIERAHAEHATLMEDMRQALNLLDNASQGGTTATLICDQLRPDAVEQEIAPSVIKRRGQMGLVGSVDPGAAMVHRIQPDPVASEPAGRAPILEPREQSAPPPSNLPSPRPDDQALIIRLSGPGGFKRTYYDAVTLDRNALRGSAPLAALHDLAGTGLEIRPLGHSVSVRRLAGCPHCKIDGVSLESTGGTTIGLGVHRLELTGLTLELSVSRTPHRSGEET